MAGVVVRPGEPEDVDAVLAVWRAASTARRDGLPPSSQREERVRAAIGKTGALMVIAEDSGAVAGMALAQQGRAMEGMGPPVPGLCFIAMVYVTPDRWGRGIGGQLVEAVIVEAGERGYDRARLWTHAANRRARRLYESRAFHPTGREVIDDTGERNVQYERRW